MVMNDYDLTIIAEPYYHVCVKSSMKYRLIAAKIILLMDRRKGMFAYLRYFVFILLLISTNNAFADILEDLTELKKLCDSHLLSEANCNDRQAKILAKYDHHDEEWFCNYGGESTPPKAFDVKNENSFNESASASSIVKDILDKAGLTPSFIVRPANVPNAAASARNGDRYIEYNPFFVSLLKSGAKTNWAIYGVMAHELGHHLQGHTLKLGGSRPDYELEADEYSGFILAKLGANLKEAQIAMETYGSNVPSTTHPQKDLRLIAIKKGWDKGKSEKTDLNDNNGTAIDKNLVLKTQVQQQQIPPPSNFTYTDSCLVNGEEVLITTSGVILSKTNGLIQVGQKVNPASPNCAFDMISSKGRFCVAPTGFIYFGHPFPVGKCAPCTVNICN